MCLREDFSTALSSEKTALFRLLSVSAARLKKQNLSVCVREDFSLVCSSFSSEKTSALFFRLLLSSVIKKLLSPLKKKPKKSKRTLLFFTFSFYSFEVTLFRIVFAFPLCCGCEHSLLLFFDSCNELLCSVFFATEGEEFFSPNIFSFSPEGGYCVCIKRARSFAESFARKREREKR